MAARRNTPIDAALGYARARGWPVFPCSWRGELRKRPLTRHGLHDASCDPDQIREWWGRWPEALIGMPTGQATAVVVDVDRKNGVDGLDTLAELGAAILPDTPITHTASGGLHIFFRGSGSVIRNTAGARWRGTGRGIDLRGDGGYVILAAPGSGVRLDGEPAHDIDQLSMRRAGRIMEFVDRVGIGELAQPDELEDPLPPVNDSSEGRLVNRRCQSSPSPNRRLNSTTVT
ncbi:MAG: bifunctional DNA primase/polymerase [Acetobacteraceae bacterium]|nr:bifunctional DNA primase/polymerase [Acetobacteraceae bacterium]